MQDSDESVTQETSSIDWCFGLNIAGTTFVYSLLLVFAFKTVHRNSEWQNKETLARSGLKVNPMNAKIHVTLGNVLASRVSHDSRRTRAFVLSCHRGFVSSCLRVSSVRVLTWFLHMPHFNFIYSRNLFKKFSFVWSYICTLKISKVSWNSPLPDLYPRNWDEPVRLFTPITELTMLFPSQGLLSCENHYREALRLRPHYVAGWENLGLVLLNTSKNI